MKKFLLYGFLAIVGIGLCSRIFKNADSQTSKALTQNSPSTQTEAEKPKLDTASKWRYSEEIDPMTSKKKRYARVDAKELLEFKFPYQGGSTATLMVREWKGDNDVILMVDKGQFTTSIGDGTAAVRFDDSPAKKYSVSSSSDGSTNVLFFGNERDFLAKLNMANKVLVEAEFYSEGNRVMEFDVQKFKW